MRQRRLHAFGRVGGVGEIQTPLGAQDQQAGEPAEWIRSDGAQLESLQRCDIVAGHLVDQRFATVSMQVGSGYRLGFPEVVFQSGLAGI